MTEEELKYMIEEIQDEGVLEQQESDLVRSALEFDEITIDKILVPRVSVEGIELSDSPDRVKELFISSKYSRLPVYEKTYLYHRNDPHLRGIACNAEGKGAHGGGHRSVRRDRGYMYP